jgi:putative two-component system response regulator
MSEPLDEQRLQGDLAAAHSQLARYAHDLKRLLDRERAKTAQIEAAHLDTLMRLTRAAECKDAETGSHLERLTHYSQVLAGCLGMAEHDVLRIGRAAPLHDVGKIGVPDVILMKDGPLDANEWNIMRRHPAIGASLLKGSQSGLIDTARQIALTHHEHWDGSGYPRGLRGEQIPIEGRIVMLADRYDALRSPRRYKAGLDHATTCALLCEGNERTRPEHIDPTLLAIFREVHQEMEAVYERHRG